jgi:hypothetical protein
MKRYCRINRFDQVVLQEFLHKVTEVVFYSLAAGFEFAGDDLDDFGFTGVGFHQLQHSGSDRIETEHTASAHIQHNGAVQAMRAAQ